MRSDNSKQWKLCCKLAVASIPLFHRAYTLGAKCSTACLCGHVIQPKYNSHRLLRP